MTKYEIEIDLPADVLAKYEPVEVRRARHGDVCLENVIEMRTGDPDPDAAKRLVDAADDVTSNWRYLSGGPNSMVVPAEHVLRLADALAAAKGGQ